MKQSINLKNKLPLLAVTFLLACGGDSTKSVEELIEDGDIDALKEKQTELKEKEREIDAQSSAIAKYLEKIDTAVRLPLVTVYKIEKVQFNHFVELQGSVEADQNVVVYPEISGTLLDFKVKMGDRVSKGQVVAVIDDGGMSQQLAQIKQRAKLSKITYEKRKRLWDQKIGSEIDFLAAETQYLADQDAVKQLEAQVSKSIVKAPFSGIIDQTIADEGQLVVPGQTPLFRILNLSNMYIKADVPEKYLGSVKAGRKVKVDLPVLDTIFTTTIKKVSNYIDPSNRTFSVEIDVPNKQGLIKPNLTAKVMINDYQNNESILIPQSVISENSEGKEYVYRADIKKDGKYASARKVFVVTGLRQGDKIEILEGLFPESAVIMEGARTVKDGQDVQIID